MIRNFVDGAIHLMRGISGAGKSTYVKSMIESGAWPKDSTIVCSADDYMLDKDGNYDFKPWKLTNAHIFCRLKFIKALFYVNKPYKHIVVDNTNIELEHMAEYILLAKASNYHLFINEIPATDGSGKPLTNTELAARAIKHGLDEGKIAQMRAKFKPFSATYMSRLCENDVMDPFHSYQNERVVVYRFDPDEKTKGGISERIKFIMNNNAEKIEKAEKTFKKLRTSKSTNIKDVLKGYKTLHDLNNHWSMLSKDNLENRLDADDEVLLNRLGVIHDYLYISSNDGMTETELGAELSALTELETAG